MAKPRKTSGKPRARRARGQSSAPERSSRSLHFSAVNGILAGAGLAALAVGYWLLAGGSVTAAPLLLVLGYIVLLPLAILV